MAAVTHFGGVTAYVTAITSPRLCHAFGGADPNGRYTKVAVTKPIVSDVRNKQGWEMSRE